MSKSKRLSCTIYIRKTCYKIIEMYLRITDLGQQLSLNKLPQTKSPQEMLPKRPHRYEHVMVTIY